MVADLLNGIRAWKGNAAKKCIMFQMVVLQFLQDVKCSQDTTQATSFKTIGHLRGREVCRASPGYIAYLLWRKLTCLSNSETPHQPNSKLQQAVASFIDWLSNTPPSWAAYWAIMTDRLLVLDKSLIPYDFTITFYVLFGQNRLPLNKSIDDRAHSSNI
jgi:hypothetical protein